MDSFSTLIRTASHEQHMAAETSAFMGDLLGGRLGVAAYARYTEQPWFVYEALEGTAGRLAADPVAGPFLRPELFRLPALERDLAHLRGPRRPGGYVAHHYTRYLGDLSGGQVIRDTAERTWGFARKGDGVRFYVFEGIANPAAFKRGYRRPLDAIPVDDLERQRVVAECRAAFALNTAVFRALGEEFPLSA